jgi:hypothetical protein
VLKKGAEEDFEIPLNLSFGKLRISSFLKSLPLV